MRGNFYMVRPMVMGFTWGLMDTGMRDNGGAISPAVRGGRYTPISVLIRVSFSMENVMEMVHSSKTVVNMSANSKMINFRVKLYSLETMDRLTMANGNRILKMDMVNTNGRTVTATLATIKRGGERVMGLWIMRTGILFLGIGETG